MVYLFVRVCHRFIQLLNSSLDQKVMGKLRTYMFYLVVFLTSVNSIGTNILRQGCLVQTLITGKHLMLEYKVENPDSWISIITTVFTFLQNFFPTFIGFIILHIYQWFGKSTF